MENRPIEIVDIYPNQPAALSDQLEIGDVIISINDTAMYNRNVRVCSFYYYNDKTKVWFCFINCRMYHRLWEDQHKI